MPGKRHSEEQIVYALRQVEGGKKVSEVCREMGVSQQAFYSWRRRYAGLGLQELRELRQLREENRKLKGIVADLTLDKHILQEVLSSEKVSEQLDRLITLRGAPESITSDNGSEFTGKAMDHWAQLAGVKLNFIRPGKPVENSYIESFNGRLRDECLNVEVFLDLADARRKLDQWRSDYNQQRPHSALADRTPDEFASVAMQLSFALSAAESAKDLTPEAVCVERFK